MSDILVGTSSWTDPGFIEHWYPPDLPGAERLPYYAGHFPLVEINSSFYAIPGERQAELWAERTPRGFTFDVKLHRYLSYHAAEPKSLPPDLRDAETDERGRLLHDPELAGELTRRLRTALAPLERTGKLGVFLLQLTPGFSPRDHRLEELAPLAEALGDRGLAIEFRHRGWVERDRGAETLAFLREHGMAFVCTDSPAGEQLTVMPRLDSVTDRRFAYLRCHGRNLEGYVHGRSVAERFDYDYDSEEVEEIAERARELADEAESVHVLFNNNARDYAPKAAKRLLSALAAAEG